jgi:hypothetical protein
MFKTMRIIPALAGSCILAAGWAFAQTPPPNHLPNPDRFFFDPDPDLRLLRKDLRGQKRQIIAANISLTDAQAQKFWPVYDQFEAEFARICDKKVPLIREYSEDLDTESYFRRRAAVEAALMELRLNYIPIFRKVLSAQETALFYRIHWRLSQLIDLQLERSPLPLAQPLMQR